MKNMSRKIQLGLVAILSATAMLVPSSLAASYTPAKPSPDAKIHIKCHKVAEGTWECTITIEPGKAAPAASVLND